MCALTFKGHKNMVRTLSVEPKGQFVATGSDDGTVKIWEIQTGYCHKSFKFGKIVQSVAWYGRMSFLATQNPDSQQL